MNKKLLTIVLVLILAICFSIVAFAAENEEVSYISPIFDTNSASGYDVIGVETKTVKDYTVIDANNPITSWGNGWYVVKGNVNLTKYVTVSGNAKVILTDGASLTISKIDSFSSAVDIKAHSSLTLYAQSEDAETMGKFTINSLYSGIGAHDMNSYNCSVYIFGGKLDITAGYVAIGPRDGFWGSTNNGISMNDIVIAGGIVNATVSGTESVIGTGHNCTLQKLVISGGSVNTTTKGESALGIGAANNSTIDNIYISGGKVKTYVKWNSAGIGAGMQNSRVKNIYISGGEIETGRLGTCSTQSTCENIAFTGGVTRLYDGVNSQGIVANVVTAANNMLIRPGVGDENFNSKNIGTILTDRQATDNIVGKLKYRAMAIADKDSYRLTYNGKTYNTVINTDTKTLTTGTYFLDVYIKTTDILVVPAGAEAEIYFDDCGLYYATYGKGTCITIEKGAKLTLVANGTDVASIYGSTSRTQPLIINNGTLECTNITIARGKAEKGSIITNNGTLILNNCYITHGNATEAGGSLYNNGTATINNTTFYDGNAPYGRDIYNKGTLNVSGNTQINHEASIYNYTNAKINKNADFTGAINVVQGSYAGSVFSTGTYMILVLLAIIVIATCVIIAKKKKTKAE